MNIDKLLNSKVNQLQIDKNNNAFAIIHNEELDPIRLEFMNDGCVTVKHDYEFITLSIENLETMKKLIQIIF